jgi:hypothetical protein
MRNQAYLTAAVAVNLKRPAAALLADMLLVRGLLASLTRLLARSLAG